MLQQEHRLRAASARAGKISQNQFVMHGSGRAVPHIRMRADASLFGEIGAPCYSSIPVRFQRVREKKFSAIEA